MTRLRRRAETWEAPSALGTDPGATDRYEALSSDPEGVFRAFVRNANAVGLHARTVRAPVPRMEQPSAEHVVPERAGAEGAPPEGRPDEPVPLTRRKPGPVGEGEAVGTVPRGPGPHTQRVQARLVVPDVASVTPPEPPVPEASEDGQIPAGELDRFLSDMGVLLRYGHRSDVCDHLDALIAKYPEDLLLLRRVAEFHMETDDYELAKERLFKLSAALFERGNVEGMREALEQVRVLEPDNRRAAKLLGLLEARHGSPSE